MRIGNLTISTLTKQCAILLRFRIRTKNHERFQHNCYIIIKIIIALLLHFTFRFLRISKQVNDLADNLDRWPESGVLSVEEKTASDLLGPIVGVGSFFHGFAPNGHGTGRQLRRSRLAVEAGRIDGQCVAAVDAGRLVGVPPGLFGVLLKECLQVGAAVRGAPAEAAGGAHGRRRLQQVRVLDAEVLRRLVVQQRNVQRQVRVRQQCRWRR